MSDLGPSERLAKVALGQRTTLWEVTEVLATDYTGRNSDPDFSPKRKKLENDVALYLCSTYD